MNQIIKIMKKIFLFLIANAFALNPSFSQGNNLQFNQVILVGTTPQTVPSYKVWKVESYIGVDQLTGICIPTTTSGYWYKAGCLQGFKINGNNYYYGTPCGSTNSCYTNSVCSGSPGSCSGFTSSSLPALPNFPFWLTSTNTLSTLISNSYFTVIEFNLVP